MRIIIVLLLVFQVENLLGQEYINPSHNKHDKVKYNLFIRGNIYTLDSAQSTSDLIYIGKDSILLQHPVDTTLRRLFSKSSFEDYLDKRDSIWKETNIELRKLIPIRITYNQLIDYIKEYTPKLDSLSSIDHSELYNSITLCNIIDEQVFLGQKKVTSLLLNYKNKFDSSFNVHGRSFRVEGGGSPYMSDKNSKGLMWYQAKYYKDRGYTSVSNVSNDSLLNIVYDIKEFYITCPLKYEFIKVKEKLPWIIMSYKHRMCPLFFDGEINPRVYYWSKSE
ncbi:hypothetical protein Fleli_0407 [Bernardetia litoralis DSM 6794]|uniref:Uncharacterized protein n=1 Tax=Bernardetia litoralis (strain ATCC 23117 / DSM 6794 / NBRC 15988 / NCIMB 1366 / Fx l1 / Sio-4) TaxID=880071 RepID=I4AFZ8_BERLS|nr:hypothetical protein [Bernardetia litoralis]AFM02883.1 hypothetical protein Fleli_0407 [Bernardetia litoralis DSM 6794]